MKLICPKCGSYDIDQYPIMHGPIWCESCGHKAKHKELYNPFVYYEFQQTQPDLPTRLRETESLLLGLIVAARDRSKDQIKIIDAAHVVRKWAAELEKE